MQSPNGFLIDRKPSNNHIVSTLSIKHATLNDAGTYTCKFGHLKETIHVNVAVSGDKLKSSEIRSNPDENQKAYRLSSLTNEFSRASHGVYASYVKTTLILVFLYAFLAKLSNY